MYLLILGCVAAACVFMLWTRHLIIVYMYTASVGLIFLSYWTNKSALGLLVGGPSVLDDLLSLNLSRLLDPGGLLFILLPYFVAQWIMGMAFAFIHMSPSSQIIQKLLPFNFVMPLVLAMLPLPIEMVKHSPVFAAIFPLILTKIALWSSSLDVIRTVFNGYQHARNFASTYGLSALVENEWQRLNVPCVLRAFWVCR